MKLYICKIPEIRIRIIHFIDLFNEMVLTVILE